MRDLLESPQIYDCVQSTLARRDCWNIFVERYLRPISGARLLDLGCGTGRILQFLPPLEYWGLDDNPHYIEYAKKKRRSDAKFVCADLRDTWPVQGSFDLVMATGLLHHLPDAEVVEVLKRTRSLLSGQGRLVTFDGCFEDSQPMIARWLLSHDRGKNVRFKEGFEVLARSVFNRVTLHVERDLLRLPYTHLVMEMTVD